MLLRLFHLENIGSFGHGEFETEAKRNQRELIRTLLFKDFLRVA
jgi:hypothetical protein